MDKVGMFKVLVTKRKYNSSTCMSKTLFASHCSEKKMSGRKQHRAGVVGAAFNNSAGIKFCINSNTKH